MYKAPFPYFGGKSEIADAVWSRLGDTPNYVEPFFGSGAVLLNRPHWQPKKTMLETVNDASGFIANFWRAVRAAPDEVAYHADNPVNECVPAGTMIATPDGEIPVEDIR
ncbi:MAG TPA: DNA adenine methylase, partial [Pseudomonadales bacterium]|nr:DNA adenine methylase [Pseudomonadales bacterium]